MTTHARDEQMSAKFQTAQTHICTAGMQQTGHTITCNFFLKRKKIRPYQAAMTWLEISYQNKNLWKNSVTKFWLQKLIFNVKTIE